MASEPDEVVVCARSPDEMRLVKLPDPLAVPTPDPLSFRLPGGGTGQVHALQTTLPGATGAGAAVTLRIPLGARKSDRALSQ